MTVIPSNGPSTTTAIQIGKTRVARKCFPDAEKNRMQKEIAKMRFLRLLGEECGLFSVPEILDVGETDYTMQWVDALPLTESAAHITAKASDIITMISLAQHPDNSLLSFCEPGELWQVMLKKFQTAKCDDDQYVELCSNLREPRRLILGYSHGDFTFDNILCDSDGNWHLIDPVWSEVESPLWDIGKFLQSTAVNWENIKTHGIVGTKSPRLTKINNRFIDRLLPYYQPEELLLGLACQLARVSRWCFPQEMMRITKQLLAIYTKGTSNECVDALRRIR